MPNVIRSRFCHTLGLALGVMAGLPTDVDAGSAAQSFRVTVNYIRPAVTAVCRTNPLTAQIECATATPASGGPEPNAFQTFQPVSLTNQAFGLFQFAGLANNQSPSVLYSGTEGAYSGTLGAYSTTRRVVIDGLEFLETTVSW